MEKQGIISILGSDGCGDPKPAGAASFRRTLSADMSSKTWLAQNGFKPTMKKIASSAIISVLDSSSEEKGEFEVENNKKQDNVWGTIISQKKSDEVELTPPYVHPLVKKSNSTLSEKSLEICTENLGSETGSDGFSSFSSSEASEFDKEEESRQEEIKNWLGDELSAVAKYNHSAAFGKKMTQKNRSFPPPLSSLTQSSNEGPHIHMHSQRVNGRLVLQAVSVPSTKNFQAQRQDGRLRLTLFNATLENKQHPVLDEAMVDQKGDEERLEEMFEIDDYEDEEMGGEVDQEDQNPEWSHKFNYKIPIKQPHSILLPQSLPPRPRARLMPGTQPASFNSYEYFWRPKRLKNQLISPYKNNTGVIEVHKPKAYEQKEIVVLRNCKETRRSLLSWETYCIATS